MFFNNKRRLCTTLSTLVVTLVCATQVLAAVNDVLPADYYPPSKGSNTLAVYAYNRKASGYYEQGIKQLDGTLNTQIMALRIGRFFEVADQPVSLIAVLPWAKADIEPAALAPLFGTPTRGMADLRLGATSWLIANRNSGQYLGITAMISLPTGDYNRKQALNIGENRHKETLSLGWILPLSQSILLELSPEIAWFGDNTDYAGGTRMEQKSASALTGYLRYRATSNWQFHVGGQINEGGDTWINGVNQNNPANNSRVMLGTTYQNSDRKQQWIVRFAKDTEIKNGFKTDAELLVRYLWMFGAQ